MQKLGRYFWVRVVVMVFSLAGVIALIYKLGQPAHNTVTLCPTRVSSLSVIGRAAVFQEGMKWYRTHGSGERTELDPIAVEKWFAEYCSVDVEKISGETAPVQSQGEPIITIAYVAGLPITLRQSDDGVFHWGAHNFRSPKLTEGIARLLELK